MRFALRAAEVSIDSKGIATLLDSVWPDEQHSLNNITASLSADGHKAFVAVDSEKSELIVGLIDNFLTVTPAGLRRWELDLLAVHPDYRGQGVGKKLVETSTQAAYEIKADLVRALVRVNNTPCHRTLAGCNYKEDEHVRILYVCSESSGPVRRLPSNVDMMPVQTCTYRGHWLEGDADPLEAMSAAIGLPSQDLLSRGTAVNIDTPGLVGVLLPARFYDGLNVPSFQVVGHYQWWNYTVQASPSEPDRPFASLFSP